MRSIHLTDEELKEMGLGWMLVDVPLITEARQARQRGMNYLLDTHTLPVDSRSPG